MVAGEQGQCIIHSTGFEMSSKACPIHPHRYETPLYQPGNKKLMRDHWQIEKIGTWRQTNQRRSICGNTASATGRFWKTVRECTI